MTLLIQDIEAEPNKQFCGDLGIKALPTVLFLGAQSCSKQRWLTACVKPETFPCNDEPTATHLPSPGSRHLAGRDPKKPAIASQGNLISKVVVDILDNRIHLSGADLKNRLNL